MSVEQYILFALLTAVFGLLIWGRWRYDLVAFAALLVAVITGVVPVAEAFSGFGHPATVIVALVLIVSRGLANSGVIGALARHALDASRSLQSHIGILAGTAAALSALMNNVAALALLMPLDIETAAKAKRSPALTLMPLSFATILGGTITLIGTPPNIVVAEFRGKALGTSYGMFDFSPVGLAITVVGLAFIAVVGWRLIPGAKQRSSAPGELLDLGPYLVELRVGEKSSAVGQRVADLDDLTEEHDCTIVGLVRKGRRMPGLARRVEIEAGDILILEAAPDAIDELVGVLKLELARSDRGEEVPTSSDFSLMETVVPETSRLVGRSAAAQRLAARYGVLLLGVSRQGRRFRERVRQLPIRPGDVLLLYGPTEQLPELVGSLGCLPLAERGLQLTLHHRVWPALAVFGGAIGLASAGLVSLPIALAVVVVLMLVLELVPARQVYESVEWPVIVLLGSMIPIGGALETSGGTALIASALVNLGSDWPPVAILVLTMVVTMTLSDVMNNVATAVIAAPVGLEIANRLGVSPDPFLMGVAVAASCAFLTPIGHKNNTLILGPGGYRFGDYWRMGLVLEILIVATAVPVILWVWPLHAPM